ncbi:MAG TPA: hypothetical protein VK011_08635 [Acidimicrobiia bacterium]|nr:hypothetical protein [Acidimicrobiia bacterium]
MRIGLAARDAARRWEESAAAILATDGEAVPEIQKVDDMAWEWSLGERESGRIEFRDAGEDIGEFIIDVDRRDGNEAARLRQIVNGFTRAAAGPGLDRPVVAVDPHRGEPAEADTDEDQPL